MVGRKRCFHGSLASEGPDGVAGWFWLAARFRVGWLWMQKETDGADVWGVRLPAMRVRRGRFEIPSPPEVRPVSSRGFWLEA